ncbi:hypothetical protein CHARACLAT_033284 [Characodon lateralis]|uniref:Uncharacterized protein n=1 Tax=Characodon lateralis TaxID=208331 RepID=A0ABU7E0A3_9TELE|nr:hypothetical protein [Characodon lateralis]
MRLPIFWCGEKCYWIEHSTPFNSYMSRRINVYLSQQAAERCDVFCSSRIRATECEVCKSNNASRSQHSFFCSCHSTKAVREFYSHRVQFSRKVSNGSPCTSMVLEEN